MLTKKSTKKEIQFDLFQKFVNTSQGESKQDITDAKCTFNFDISSGELRSGYGFKKLQSPTSKTDLKNEEEVLLAGSQVLGLWPLRWYDDDTNQYKYYVVYFNDNNSLAFANLFDSRPIPLQTSTKFTSLPIASSAAYKGNDALVFSQSGIKGLHLMSGVVSSFFENAPSVTSVCCHNDNLYAITGDGREKLVYSQNQEITEWTDGMSEISFNDDLGRLNKVVTFNDYVYVIRDFGINKISFYSTRGEYDLSQIYQADSFIYPKTIASSGDKIYFLDGAGLCSFNGSSVSRVELDCQKMLQNADKSNASAACFEGKYFLACRLDFDDGLKIGCEEGDFVNNCLFVFDLTQKTVNLCRGVDISGLSVLNNPYKSKVVACFNGANIDKIGEICHDGKIFDQTLPKVWKSVMCDFDAPEKIKTAKFLTIKTDADCQVTLQSERGSKTYDIFGSDKLQRIRVDISGKELSIEIMTQAQQIKISNLKLGLSLV